MSNYDLDLTEAIKTAAWAIDPVDGMEDEGRDALTAAVVAAVPLILRQAADQAAAQLETFPLAGRHTRAWWMVSFLRMVADRHERQTTS